MSANADAAAFRGVRGGIGLPLSIVTCFESRALTFLVQADAFDLQCRGCCHRSAADDMQSIDDGRTVLHL